MSFSSREISLQAGGLILWPVKLLIPVGFLLLLLQGVSQAIKLVAALSGSHPPQALLDRHNTQDDEVTGTDPGASARWEPWLTAWLVQYIGPLMFAGLVLFLLLGYPVAFALSAIGLLFGFVGVEVGLLHPQLLQALPQRIYGVMQNDTLLAIPFFTFMGLVLERSGMAEDLLETIGQLFGPIRGGLAYSVIFVGGLLAATTGVVAASVIAMGLISLPIMMRYGYDKRLSSGVIAASGTLAQIIPPSLVLIVMADQLGKSIGDLYRGALVPGLMLMGLYAGYVFIMSLLRPASVPALPPEARTLRGTLLVRRAAHDDSAGGPDLPGAGHDLPGHRHADRGRCDGRVRRTGAGRSARATELARACGSPWTRPRSCPAS